MNKRQKKKQVFKKFGVIPKGSGVIVVKAGPVRHHYQVGTPVKIDYVHGDFVDCTSLLDGLQQTVNKQDVFINK